MDQAFCPCDAEQCRPILEAQYVPLQHLGIAEPIVVCVVSVQQGVSQPVFLCTPPIQLGFCRRQCALPPAPGNTNVDEVSRMFHGPPFWYPSPCELQQQIECQPIEISTSPS